MAVFYQLSAICSQHINPCDDDLYHTDDDDFYHGDDDDDFYHSDDDDDADAACAGRLSALSPNTS